MNSKLKLKTIAPGRVYQKWSTNQILRFKTFLFVSKLEFLVKNLNKGYNVVSKVIGSKITNKIIDKVYGDLFIGGKDTATLKSNLENLKKDGFVSIADFAIEFLNENEEHKVNEIVQNFIDTLNTAYSVDKDNMIAIKVSSLIPVSYLKTINKLQHYLSILERAYFNNYDYKQFIDEITLYKLNEINKINENNYNKFTEDICTLFSNLNNKSKDSKFNLIEYICKSSDTDECLKQIISFFNIDDVNTKNLVLRIKKLEVDLRKVIDHSKNLGTSVMIDAEQTYLQISIDYLIYYLMKEYNNNNQCILMNTIQMYLKDSVTRLSSLFNYCRDNNINMGVKLVRGAYMNEEKKLSTKFKYPDPICNGQAETDKNYNTAVEISLEKIQKNDKVIFATHNYETINYINHLYESCDKSVPKSFIVAQLMGIGQHAAWLSHDKFVRFIYLYIF
jgi:proline dehydrogenase